MKRVLALLPAVILASTFTANAQLRVCNKSGEEILVAYAYSYYENAESVTTTQPTSYSKGWYRIDAGECSTISKAAPKGEQIAWYDVFAESADTSTIWTGKQSSAIFCVNDQEDFEFDRSHKCDDLNEVKRNFVDLKYGDDGSFVTLK